ncbi:MAG: hypothetical protein ACR2HE_12670 [Casimicrobiaceae bacterium]
MGRRKHEGTAADGAAGTKSTLDELGNPKSRVLSWMPPEIREAYIQGNREYALMLFFKWPSLAPRNFFEQLRYLAGLLKQAPLESFELQQMVEPQQIFALELFFKVLGFRIPQFGASFNEHSDPDIDRYFPDFKALFRDLGGVVDRHTHPIIQYAQRRYHCPLLENAESMSSDVMDLAFAIAMVEHSKRLDGWLVNAELKRIGKANTAIGIGRANLVKHLFPPDSAMARRIDREIAKRRAKFASFVKAGRRRGRPTDCKRALSKLFTVAGLSSAAAESHASDVTRRVATPISRSPTGRAELTERRRTLAAVAIVVRDATRRAGVYNTDPVALNYHLDEIIQPTVGAEIKAQGLLKLSNAALRKWPPRH